MEDAPFGRRRQQRDQQQQQPQQSIPFPALAGVAPGPASRESRRVAHQQLADTQARKQSGRL